MLTYRSHICDLVMDTSGKATRLVLSLSRCEMWHRQSNYRELIRAELPNLHGKYNALRQAVNTLTAALPLEVNNRVKTGTSLVNHLGFIDYYLNKNELDRCAGNALDIVQIDLPSVTKQFNQWYENQSPPHGYLSKRLESLITAGELDSAARAAWPILKSRMVEIFGLPEDLDGHTLANRVFGSTGCTAGILPGSKREAYLNLLKGLYSLERTPVSHNDIIPGPAELDAVLALVNSMLVRIESLTVDQSNS